MSSNSWQQGAPATRADEARRSNERIVEQATRLHFVSRIPLLCECDDDHCREFVLLPRGRYEALRDDATYLTAPGHTVERAMPSHEAGVFWLHRRRRVST